MRSSQPIVQLVLKNNATVKATPSMSTAFEIVREAAETLNAITETPRLDAEILLAHAMGVTRSQLLTRLNDQVEQTRFDHLLQRRRQHEPIAYILGEWEFFSLSFEMQPPVLVPRPETEHLVEAVLEFIQDRPARIFEIGTGTGCISIAIAANAPKATVFASDCNETCIELATRNAQRHSLSARVRFEQSDCFEALTIDDGPFDVVCSNPPYIAESDRDTLPRVVRDYEDPQALFSGVEGLDMIRRIATEAPRWLRPGGLLALEIGMGQHGAVKTILENYGFRNITFRNDLAGIERIALAHT